VPRNGFQIREIQQFVTARSSAESPASAGALSPSQVHGPGQARPGQQAPLPFCVPATFSYAEHPAVCAGMMPP